MTRGEARHWLEIELKTWEDECKSKHPIKEALSVAIETLGQEPVLDKIREEIEEQVLESLSDGGDDWFAAEKVNECLEIIDKYKKESENP